MNERSPRTGSKPRIMMVASGGGHLVQLCRLVRAMERDTAADALLVTSGALPEEAPAFAGVAACTDFSRDDPWRALHTFAEIRRLLRDHRPEFVVTTGAAPGLVAIVAARMRGLRCLWIDSLANPRRLSLSGRLARLAGATVISQWPAVARRHGVGYHGSVL